MIRTDKTFRCALLAGFCASALIVGGCLGGDKPAAEEITVSADSLGLSSADETALSRHFDVEARAGTEEETRAALSALKIGEGFYESVEVEGSNAVFTNWSATGDAGTVTAETVRLLGLHGTDDGQTADKVILDGVRVVSREEADDGSMMSEVDATIDTLVVVQPSPALMASLTEVMTARDSGSDTVEELTGEQEFRAMRIEDFAATVTDEEGAGTFTLKQVVIGNDTEDGQLDAVIESVLFEREASDKADDSDAFRLEMDGLTLMGFVTSDAPQLGGGMMGMLAQAGTLVSSTGLPPYRQVDLGEMSITSSLFDLETDGFEADTTVRGDKTTLRSVLSPMVVSFKDVSTTPLAPYIDVMRENGLAEISIKGSGTTELDRKADVARVIDQQFDIDGGLRFDCNYEMSGVVASSDYLRESGFATPPAFDMEAEDRDAAISAYVEQMEAYQAAQGEASELVKINALSCDIQDVPDNSLVTRGYAVAAEMTGKPVAVLKGGAKTMIAMSSLMAPSEFERDVMDVIGGGLIDFIDTPGQTISITMNPVEPMSIASLTSLQSSGNANFDDLGLTVEVKGQVED